MPQGLAVAKNPQWIEKCLKPELRSHSLLGDGTCLEMVPAAKAIAWNRDSSSLCGWLRHSLFSGRFCLEVNGYIVGASSSIPSSLNRGQAAWGKVFGCDLTAASRIHSPSMPGAPPETDFGCNFALCLHEEQCPSVACAGPCYQSSSSSPVAHCWSSQLIFSVCWDYTGPLNCSWSSPASSVCSIWPQGSQGLITPSINWEARVLGRSWQQDELIQLKATLIHGSIVYFATGSESWDICWSVPSPVSFYVKKI